MSTTTIASALGRPLPPGRGHRCLAGAAGTAERDDAGRWQRARTGLPVRPGRLMQASAAPIRQGAQTPEQPPHSVTISWLRLSRACVRCLFPPGQEHRCFCQGTSAPASVMPMRDAVPGTPGGHDAGAAWMAGRARASRRPPRPRRRGPGAGWATAIAAFSSTTAGALNFRDHPRLGGHRQTRRASPRSAASAAGQLATSGYHHPHR